MAKYNQRQCERIIFDRLMEEGYLISRYSNDVPKYSIHQAFNDNKKLSFLVRHLEYDNAYKNSPLPYPVYKIEAFNIEEEQLKGQQLLLFIVGRPGRTAGTPPSPLEVRESLSGGPCR